MIPVDPLPMNSLFGSTLLRLNRIKSRSHLFYAVFSVLRAAAIGIIITSLWNGVVPGSQLLHISIGLATFIAIIRFSSLTRTHKITQSAMLLSLDIQHPTATSSPYNAAFSESDSAEWRPRLQREEKRLRAFESRRLTTLAGSLLVPSLAAILFLFKAPINVATAMTEVKNVITALTGGVTLEVLDGAAPIKRSSPHYPIAYSLSVTSPPEIKLVRTNMLKLTVVKVDVSAEPPVLLLQPSDKGAPLSIQLNSASTTTGSVWFAEFTASETSDVLVPLISERPLAKIVVQDLPTPKVQMKLDSDVKEPWPDQEFLPLNIVVTGSYPLEKVLLKIITKNKTYSESVLNISGTTRSVSTSYKLNLQPWMEEDIMEFEVVAEAIDRAEPDPLVGRSAPLRLKVASAYGRYRNALESLKNVKAMIDDARSSGRPLSEEARKIMDSALRQSDETPFFDGIDRSDLGMISQSLNEVVQAPGSKKIHELADSLGKFLLEHEILDDRERDRDFFIAIRSLSRLLEQQASNNADDIKHMIGNMSRYLSDRHKRWSIRVGRLAQNLEPPSWHRINRDKPFHGAINNVLKDKDNHWKLSQSYLSSLANDYRAWIEELEAKEDQQRARQEQERQQGLANARSDLRELQQRQDQISTNLDHAAEHSHEEISQKWPPSRLSENSNVKQATNLLKQLRSLSPAAGERLEAAIESMAATINSGESSNWAAAEASADFAGRLLRDADQAAGKSQKQKDRGRRRKTSGDDYHGSAIGGQVDIKSEYRVDPRYREDILHDVESELNNDENRPLLDGWLRQVVR